jgi:tetratricopeptide repeat protein
VVYPDQRVQDLFDEETVPLQFEFSSARELRERYDVTWTPTLVLTDADGRMHAKVVPASLPVEEFIPVVLASVGRANASMRHPDVAIAAFDRVAREYPNSLAAPESLYWRGVAYYAKSDKDAMKRSWTELGQRHPNSYWAKATTFFRESM